MERDSNRSSSPNVQIIQVLPHGALPSAPAPPPPQPRPQVKMSLPKQQRSKLKEWFCRIDVCWTLFFFLFLTCVGCLTTGITWSLIYNALLENLHDVHNLHITTLYKKIDLGTERVYSMAGGFLSLHSQTGFKMNSEETLATLCTILTTFDTTLDFRSFAVTSLELKEAITCMHGDPTLSSLRQLYGWMTINSLISGVYLISNTTYKFERPLQPVYGGWPGAAFDLSATFNSIYQDNEIFALAADYYVGTTNDIDYTKMWRAFSTIPHILSCTVPAGFLFRGLQLPSGVNVTDYVDVRINGAGLLSTRTSSSLTNITAAIFINATLSDDDPQIMSDNWKQASVNDTEILITYTGGQVTYLKVSEVSNDLMRAALKHVNLKHLQREDCNESTDFDYKGAPATVTAITLTTEKGLVLPMVFVSSHAAIAPPYQKIMRICAGVNATAIFLFTALFWFLIHHHLRNPLHRIATLLLLSVKRGSRALFRANRHDCVALTEVQQLGDAHNAAMRQLREVDAFIPEAVRQMLRAEGSRSIASASLFRSLTAAPGLDHPAARSKYLMTHLSTAVYLTIRPSSFQPANSVDHLVRLAAEELPERHRLVAIAASAAFTVPLVNSGPFSTPASLEAFAEKLQDLCDRHHGMVLRLTPDSCVLHFSRSVRADLVHQSRLKSAALEESDTAANPLSPDTNNDTEAKLKSLACKDARDAMDFTLQLQAWLDERDAGTFPDVRALVDTSMFTCGHYRPQGSEQMMAIAMGRDMQREVGHVPALIGVRVAMTEETASCVRAGQRASGRERGVRQIPVEALRTGRVGLDDDVVVLFEALPGRASGDDAWCSYQHCCFNAFSAMVRGDYVAALRCYKGVADISDLEPGLMPASLRREAASSDVTGGAVSTQVERLMRECEQRIRRGCTEGFHRERHVPFGIDAVMQHAAAASPTRRPFQREHPARRLSVPIPPTPHRAMARSVTAAAKDNNVNVPAEFPEALERFVVDMLNGSETVRTVIAAPPRCVQDESGLVWRMATRPIEYTPEAFWRARFLGLGSAGALATINFMAFREIPPMIANAIRDAPIGPMSDALRSAVPVFCATPQQKANVHTLFRKVLELQHPNLLVPLGYSTSPEGGVALVWEFFAGGTLRQVAGRYAFLKPITISRFMHGVLSALVFLHKRGLVHGSLHMDNVMVGADGTCKVHGHTADTTLRCKLCVCPRTCCVSPAMAAGAAPTPACDMFCYGLMCLEMLSGKRPWKWAAAREDGQLQRSEEELEALMKAADQPFYDAVVDGSVVVNTDVMIGFGLENVFVNMGRTALLKCLSYDPAQRPTSAEALQVTKAMLRVKEASN